MLCAIWRWQIGKIRIHVSALRGNQRYEKAVQLITVDSSENLKHSGILDIAVTFKHPSMMGIPMGVLQRVRTKLSISLVIFLYLASYGYAIEYKKSVHAKCFLNS